MKPYYQDKWVTIYHADCRDILPLIPDKSIDLVLTDPPYGVRKDDWDDKLEFVYFVQEWIQKLTLLAPIIIWFTSSKHLPQMLQGRNDFHRLLIWNKPPGTQYAGSSHNNIWYSFEPILVFGNEKTIIKKGGDSPYSYAVFNASTTPERNFNHPTSKPESLINWLVQHYSDKDDIILDPFLGSGTTCYCAKKLNRYSIGIEIEEKYCEIAANRCRQMVMEFNI